MTCLYKLFILLYTLVLRICKPQATMPIHLVLFCMVIMLNMVNAVAGDQTSSDMPEGNNGLHSRFKSSECAEGDAVCQSDLEKDLQGLEAIKSIHRQIDDDHNGNVDLSESDEFLRDELQYKTDFERQHTLHGEDKLISVDDLWISWKYSEVYNWTVEQTVSWLCDFVGLPQYAESFRKNAIEGSAIPRLAINSAQFLTSIIGIIDPIHRQKISLKAMDVVLFGPPKPMHSYLKDTTLLVSLVVAVGGCWFAYVQHRYSQSHIKQMLKDMEGLQTAEDALSEMQERLDRAQEEHRTAIREKQTIEAKLTDQISRAMQEAQRLREARKADIKDGGCNTQVELEQKLRLAEEELAQLRNALQEAERRLESGSEWHPPAPLQQWLQLTYEIEKKYYSFKKNAADKQLREAKDVVEKIRKKRGTFMGSFRIAHGNILDDVDARIVNARSTLAEVTTELKERLHRWAMLEGLCDFSIINNPGIHHLITTLGVTMPESSTSPIGAAMVVGSLAHVEAHAPMGLDECDEDMPPPPTYISAISTSNRLHHQSLQTSSTLSLFEDKLSMKKSKSTNNIGSYGSTPSLIHVSNTAVKSSTHQTNPQNFTEVYPPHKKPDSSNTCGSQSTNRPQTLHVSQSENALASLADGSEHDKRRTESARGHESKKSKKDSKKCTVSQQSADTDSLDMDEEKKKKKRLRIPGLSASSKVEKLKTC